MFKMILSSLVITLFSLLTLANAQSAPVTDLYQAQVPVQSREAAQRQNALPRALADVLVKVSGNAKIGQLPSIQKQLVAAEDMVLQYSYIGQAPNLSLKVTFQPNAIQRVLQQAGVGVWNENRPNLVAWVAVIDTLGERLLSVENSPELAELVLNQAGRRGLPVSLPLLDLQDIQALTLKQVRELDAAAIEAASKRYAPAGILVGTLQQVSQARWNSHWTLLYQGQRVSWDEEGEHFPAVAKAGIADVVDSLASKTVVVENKQDTLKITLHVGRINSAADYKKVYQFLQQLKDVKRVEVLSVEARAVTFQLEALAKEQAIMAAIAANPMLVPSSADASPAQNGTLDYQYTV
jgi:hypothetical protein